MEDIIQEVNKRLHDKGTKYRVGTTDYFIKEITKEECTIFICESNSLKKDPMDWIRNFKIKPFLINIADEDIYVHRGFYEGFIELWEDIEDKIKQYKEITISGYSHGAGIAPLLYLTLKDLYPHIDLNATVLFGCPRVFSFLNIKGFKAMKDLCKGITTVRLGNDIVSRVPFWFMGYGSVGKELKFKIDRKRQNPIQWFKSLFLDHGSYYSYFS